MGPVLGVSSMIIDILIRRLMHVKCIYELCTILLVFQSYLHHIRVISLLYNDFWEYYIYFLFMELTLRRQKTLFFFLLCFRDPNIVQITCNFTSVIFRKEHDLEAKEANKRKPGGQTRGAHVASVPGSVGPTNLGLVAPLSSMMQYSIPLIYCVSISMSEK